MVSGELLLLKLQKIVDVEKKQNTLVVTPKGDAISFRESDVIAELRQIHELIDGLQNPNLVIDLNSSKYFGSMMLGEMVRLGQKAVEKGGKVAMCSVSDQVQQVLDVMKLADIWPQFNSRNTAIKYLRNLS